MNKTLFFGTPDYVLPIVKALPGLTAVVTQKPKPDASPIEKWAKKNGAKVIYNLENTPKADLGVVAAYGKIIPKNVISKFKRGVINIHPSLLPKYRGASPVQAAIAAGEKTTGVTFIKMDEEVDHGPIISRFTEKILPSDTTDSLRKRLFKKSAQALIAPVKLRHGASLISNCLNGNIKPKPQNHKKATFTKILKKEDGYIELESQDAATAERFIRSMYPWPGAWTKVSLHSESRNSRSSGHKVTKKSRIRPSDSKRLRILKAHAHEDELILDEVQLEGKNPVTWKQFLEGYPNMSLRA